MQCLVVTAALFGSWWTLAFVGFLVVPTSCSEKVPIVSAFTGQEYVVYNFSSRLDPVITKQEAIELWFKTRQANGFLIMSVDNNDYIYLGLRDGFTYIATSLGSANEHMHLKDVRVDDDQWHQVTITRDARQLVEDHGICYVKVTVDGHRPEMRSITGRFPTLSSRAIYLAGTPHRLHSSLPTAGFTGCVKHVSYIVQAITFDLLRMAKEDNKLAFKHGAISFNQCQGISLSRAAAFVTRDSYITHPRWIAQTAGTISISFTTTASCGLLLYQSRTQSKSDMFAIEIVDGLLFVMIDLGSGITKVRAGEQPVNDGQEHTITVQHNGRTGLVQLDRSRKTYTVESIAAGAIFGSDGLLDSDGLLFIAGISSSSEENILLPPELWSASLKCSFTGCIHHMLLNGEAIDIAKAGQEQGGHVQSFCPALESKCLSQPCSNGGYCIDGADRYVCDCSFTDYSGGNCLEPLVALQFNGDHYYKIYFKKMLVTQAEDILVRFRTKQSYGRLLATTGDSSNDRLEMSLLAGRLLVALMLGGTSKILQIGDLLNDNRYHTARLSRRGRLINMTLDRLVIIEEMLEGDRLTLPVQALHIASFDNDGGLSSQENFIGHIQKVQLNGIDLVRLLHSPNKRYDTDTNAVFDDKDPPVRLPVSFNGHGGHISLPTLRTYPTLSLFFQFRSIAADGLLFYNGVRGGDFFMVELVNSTMHAVFRKGSMSGDASASNTVVIESSIGVTDGRWHDVTIMRTIDGRTAMRIDWNDWIKCNSSCGSHSQPVKYDLSGPLYVGGMTPQVAASVAMQLGRQPLRGFIGCIGSLDINGMRPNLATDGGSKISPAVQQGCSAFDALCTEATCRNGGVCNHSGISKDLCDCDSTSFTGPVCSDDSTTYLFGGSRPGAISYHIAPEQRRDTRGDRLAFGFLSHSNNSVLFRAVSGNSSDYLEVRVKDGFVYVVYNIGSQDHPITDALHQVVDGKYHVLRFERQGPNATLQLDNRPVQVKIPGDEVQSVFNSIAYISIGGRLDFDRLTITQPFKGLISGLVFNKMRPLDRAKENHSSVRLHGDVRLEDMQSTKLSAATLWRTTDPTKNQGGDIVLAANENMCINSITAANCMNLHRESYNNKDSLIVPTLTVIKPPTVSTSPSLSHMHSTRVTDVKAASAAPGLMNQKLTSTQGHLDVSTSAVVLFANSRELSEAENNSDVTYEQDGMVFSFDLMKNIPLVGGISGAVLLTVLLIVIVACKLSRKEGGAYKVKKSVTLDEGLPNDTSGKHPPTASPSSAKATDVAATSGTANGSTKSVREWYV